MPRLSSVARSRATDWTGFLFHAGLGGYALAGAGAAALSLLPTVAYDLMMAVAFLIRKPVRASVSSPPARLAAYGRVLFLLLALGLMSRYRPEWMVMTPQAALWLAAAACVAGGLAVSAWALWHLRSSFSIEPQARELTTGGPYRYVRHPIYSGYVLQYAGLWLLRPTPQLALVLAIWGLFVWWSIQYEEETLVRVFPQYAAYRETAGAVVPRLTRRVARSAVAG